MSVPPLLLARRNAELQYNEKTVPTAATFSEHLEEFDELWDWWEAQWLTELSKSEREKFDVMRADSTDRQAFRIIRNFAQLVSDQGSDFKIVGEHLAKRLGVTLQTACNIRQRFCVAGILAQTAEYVPQKFAAPNLPGNAHAIVSAVLNCDTIKIWRTVETGEVLRTDLINMCHSEDAFALKYVTYGDVARWRIITLVWLAA